MKLISVGLSTTTTSLDNLSKLVLTEKELAEAMRYVKHLGLQTVILSTCNRIEMYMTVNSKIQGENAPLIPVLSFFSVQPELFFQILLFLID